MSVDEMTSAGSDTATAPPYFRGSWITPDDPGYDEHRAHYNKRFDRRPALIARCAGVQDVRAALAFAREQGWEVAVRGGGRAFNGGSSIEGGLLLDLSPMKGVFVDLERRTARIAPGATQSDVLTETVPYGLAPITGQVSHVGFIGVAIYGGAGTLSGRHGWGCDSILSAQVVLANGDVVTASATSNQDLFWAIRGAGDNFGVIVSMEVQLHAVPESVTVGSWSWPLDQAAELMRAYGELEETFSEDVFAFVDLLISPATEGELRYSLSFYHLGDDAAVARDVAALDAFPAPRERFVEVVDWRMAHHIFDEEYPSCRQYWASTDAPRLDRAAQEALLEEARRMNEAHSGGQLGLTWTRYHHAMLRHDGVPPAAMKGGRRGGQLLPFALYDDPDLDQAYETWAEGSVQRLRDAGVAEAGVQPNFTTRPDMRIVWGDDYDRLAALKTKYDPENVFRHNYNIPPA